MRCRFYIILFLLAAVNISLFAQSEVPVRWSMTAKMISNDEGLVTIKAKISDGWHVYGFEMPDSGPIATTIDFSTSAGIAFTSDIAPDIAPTKSGKECYWDKNVRFTRKFKIIENKQSIKAEIRYTACNGNTCMPPKKIILRVNQIRKNK